MDPTIAVAVLALISSLGGIVVANRYAARGARSAQEAAQRIENTKVDAEAYKRARESYDAALKEQEQRIARLRKEMEDDRREHERDMAECLRRIERLEGDLERDRGRLRRLASDLAKLSAWARRLIRSLRSQGIAYDPPPIELGDTDPYGNPAIRGGPHGPTE